MRILIAGGGIGGLTLALMLHARGIDCVVNEAASEVKPLGVGINALPHAVKELAQLGLLPELDRLAIRTRSLTYANHQCQTILSDPRGLNAGHSVPQFSIHRGYLQELLWNTAVARLGPETIRTNQKLVGYQQDERGVTARFASENGSISEQSGDALVGADGIHSWLRASLHPDDPGIRWTGITQWRGATDWPAFDGGDAMVIAGDDVVKLILYPIAEGRTPATRLTNWVINSRVAAPDAPPPSRESWSRRGVFEDFAPLVKRLNIPIIDLEALIRSTADIFEYPMCDRDPLPWWSDRRVTLLGDAAHPMYPVGSNGASQAILDARDLSDRLTEFPVLEALKAYEQKRLPATANVVRSNRIGGPERVLDFVAGRAPAGFHNIGDVATPAEISEIVHGYAGLAGFAAV